LSLNRVR